MTPWSGAAFSITSRPGLEGTVDIADQAARGAMVPRRVAIAVENSGPAILEQLALLRTVAAARSRTTSWRTLQQRVPADWSVDIDRTIGADWPG